MIDISFFDIQSVQLLEILPKRIYSICNFVPMHQILVTFCLKYIDGSAQNCGNVIANAVELRCFQFQSEVTQTGSLMDDVLCCVWLK